MAQQTRKQISKSGYVMIGENIHQVKSEIDFLQNSIKSKQDDKVRLEFIKSMIDRKKMFFTEFLPFMRAVFNETAIGKKYSDKDALEFIIKWFTGANIFVTPPLQETISKEINQDANFDPNFPLDLPFKSCYFEMPKGFYEVGIVNQTNAAISGQIVLENYSLIFLLALEIEGKNFIFSYGFKNDELPKFFIYREGEPNSDVWLKKLVWGVLKNMKQSVPATEKITIRQKIKINGKNIHYKIKEVIHLLPNKKSHIYKVSEDSNIDWSHRWEVMGHWRKIAGIGKDRNNKYCMNGVTWVSPHQRGPESKPLIKKIRISSEANA